MTGYQCDSCKGRQPEVRIVADNTAYHAAMQAAQERPPDDRPAEPSWPDGDPEPMPTPRGKRRR